MRRPWVVALLVVLAFAYGVAAAQYRLFPIPLLVGLKNAVAGLFGHGPLELGPGSWQLTRAHVDSASGPDRDVIAELANLPYARGSQSAPETVDVTIHEPDATFDGVNLVVSGHAPWAALVDMRGNVLHEWRIAFEDVWPGPLGFDGGTTTKECFRRAHVYPNGDLLAIFEGIGMVKLDRDSNVVWEYLGRAHHDIWVDEDGSIFTLTRRETRQVEGFRVKDWIFEDFITVLSHDGVEQRRVSVLKCFLDSEYYGLMSLIESSGDVLHTNTVYLMDGRHADRHPMFAKGNVMISVPTINVIAVIDLRQEKVIWALAGQWMFQHEPQVTDGGYVLLFDNLGYQYKSKVIEFDPFTQEIVWDFRSTPERDMWSQVCGSCQRLPNGNTLIVESTAGRAFEVAPDRRIVWEYVSPYRAGERNELIATLFDVFRIERGYFAVDFAAIHDDYATGARRFDLAPVDRLIERLR